MDIKIVAFGRDGRQGDYKTTGETELSLIFHTSSLLTNIWVSDAGLALSGMI